MQKGKKNNLLALGSKGLDKVVILNVLQFPLCVSKLHLQTAFSWQTQAMVLDGGEACSVWQGLQASVG